MIDGEFYPLTHSDERCVQLFDFLAMSLHEISSISLVRSERILNQAINKLPLQINSKLQGNKHLFSVLSALSAKFLENKSLTYPVSADTFSHNNYMKDVQNSMALMYKKYITMWSNLKQLLAFEVLVSTTALGYI